MEDLWVFRDTMSRAQRARRCWRALAKWQFEKATISTWAQVLVKRANVWFNKIVALMLRGPGLQPLTWSSNCQQCLRSKVCEWTEVVKRKRTEKTKLWRNGKGMVINLLVQRSYLPESGLLLAWIDRRR